MKSKRYILIQIAELLRKNRGLCDEEIDDWMDDNENKTVYELLVIKKELAESPKEYADVSTARWFRG